MKEACEKKLDQWKSDVLTYIDSVEGLSYKVLGDVIEVCQKVDQKVLQIEMLNITEVLNRDNKGGNPFIQINFTSGKKILLTESLIGFKPRAVEGLDLKRLPKVVTTPDLLSVFEAIEEAVNTGAEVGEINMLKRVFSAILTGGEDIGFDLKREKYWIHSPLSRFASA